MATTRIRLRDKLEVPPGDYELVIQHVRKAEDRYGGLDIHWVIIGGDHDQTRFKSRVFPEKIEELLASLGMDPKSSLTEERLQGELVIGSIQLRRDRRKERSYITVRHFRPANSQPPGNGES